MIGSDDDQQLKGSRIPNRNNPPQLLESRRTHSTDSSLDTAATTGLGAGRNQNSSGTTFYRHGRPPSIKPLPVRSSSFGTPSPLVGGGNANSAPIPRQLPASPTTPITCSPKSNSPGPLYYKPTGNASGSSLVPQSPIGAAAPSPPSIQVSVSASTSNNQQQPIRRRFNEQHQDQLLSSGPHSAGFESQQRTQPLLDVPKQQPMEGPIANRRSSMLMFDNSIDKKKQNTAVRHTRMYFVYLALIAFSLYMMFTYELIPPPSFLSNNNGKAQWQQQFEALRKEIESQKHQIASLHNAKTEVEERARRIDYEKSQAQEKAAKLEQEKKKMKKKIVKLEGETVDGVGVWKPKPTKKKKADKAAEKLDNFVQHHSTKQEKVTKKHHADVDERQEFSSETKDGLKHDDREKTFEKTEMLETDETLAAIQRAQEAASMRFMEELEIKTLIDEMGTDGDMWAPEDSDISPIHTFNMLPTSSVWCQGKDRASRICRFRNLCYSPNDDKWFISQTNRTVQHNVPVHRKADGLLELTSVEGHENYVWDFDEVSPFQEKFRNVKIRYENDLHIMFMRFHPNNLMHALHDDFIGIYHMLKEYVGGGSFDSTAPFSMDSHRLMVLDVYGETATSKIYNYLSKKSTRYRYYLNLDDDVVTCFRDAILGSNKIGTWYQYGFTEPQSPIPEKQPNGNLIREATEFIVRQMGLQLGDDEKLYRPLVDSAMQAKNSRLTGASHEQPLSHTSKYDSSVDFIETDLTIVISRKRNRLILNEEDLVETLKKQYGYEVVVVSMEKHSLEDMVGYVRRARIVVGMHGSLLSLGAFCRRGTALVEMFPFGVPPEDYTPYKTMAQLPGINIVYKSWMNTDESATIGHPDRHRLHGGLDSLSPEERTSVLETKVVPKHTCCSSPYWLYRIYQDTRVDIDEIVKLINEAVVESRMVLGPIRDGTWNPGMTELLPPLIEDITCLESPDRPAGELWMSWGEPWNGAHVEKYSVHVKNNGREYESQGPLAAIDGFKEGEEVIFYIRPVVGKFYGEFKYSGSCVV